VRLLQPPSRVRAPPRRRPCGRSHEERRGDRRGARLRRTRLSTTLPPLLANAEPMVGFAMAPIARCPRPRPACTLRRTGALPTSVLVRAFRTDEARGLLAGASAHGLRPLSSPPHVGFALLFTTIAHFGGWPLVEGGSERLVDAMTTGSPNTARACGRDSGFARATSSRRARSCSSTRRSANWSGCGADRSATASADRLGDTDSPRRVQGRLGARRTGALGRANVPCGRHGAPGRHVRGGGRRARRRERRAPSRSALLIIANLAWVDATRAPAGYQTLWGYCTCHRDPRAT